MNPKGMQCCGCHDKSNSGKQQQQSRKKESIKKKELTEEATVEKLIICIFEKKINIEKRYPIDSRPDYMCG